ncbi:MAG: hypothetical protein KZQ83_14740 [gamma proteobacterium symbiont of Taylorina sp.]|nr:hypothetical protein [gamma proteobacterium symbiont of Taylorina sp.]
MFLATRLNNEICIDADLIFCDCDKEHTKYERGGHCFNCGGAVEGILLIIDPENE